jgi:acyl-CoA thioesterase I
VNTGATTTLSIILATAIIVAASLLWLYGTVGHYKNFWSKKSAEQGDFTYIALGDSAAQGIGATSPMRGYVGLIAKDIQNSTGKKVQVINVSKTGAKVADVLDRQIPAIQQYQPDLVTIEIGANDVTNFDAVKFQQQFEQLVQALPPNTLVSNLPYFGSRPKARGPAKQASQIIANAVATRKDLKFVDLQKITQEKDALWLYAPDYFHPNNLGYKNWAKAFLEKT